MDIIGRGLLAITEPALVRRVITGTKPGKALSARFVAGEMLDDAIAAELGRATFDARGVVRPGREVVPCPADLAELGDGLLSQAASLPLGAMGERGVTALENRDAMPGATFFPDATLNFAENLLRKSGAGEAIASATSSFSSRAAARAGCSSGFA